MGCGTARHLAELYSRGYHNVYGFDFSQNLINQALNNHPELENHLFTKDIRELRLSKKADVIICNDIKTTKDEASINYDSRSIVSYSKFVKYYHRL